MSSTVDFGIDLGTTNSCVARWESGAVRVFQNNDQMNVTPSAVHILKTGRVIVGRRGYSAVLTDPENVAIEFKRWMGQKDRKRFPAAQREVSAEELSAEILKSLREDVRRQTGTDMNAAVITVPAAFGALQCAATSRAATLAGLEEAPLLQEPIAAAIGYGVCPGSSDERWMVFDLGGGTLDIAVISTREGRLNVLEHRGNNLLGGKDIDRLIVEQILLPAIEVTYSLPGLSQSARNSLVSRLRIKAEEAKIDLSSDNDIVVSLFDVGEDDKGETIELEIPILRSQLESLMEPLLLKCCALAQEALEGARLTGSALDRILLVGGPTQSPFLRSMLNTQLGAVVDFSADPMTVVGRGAAVYAATLERARKSVAVQASQTVSLKLAYEPVSAESQCTVAGLVANTGLGVEIKLDAEGGMWTSGWITPKDGFFEIAVLLKEGDITTFWVYARDSQGRLLETNVPDFKIRHGLIPSEPPLPHTLSFEVTTSEGKPILDPVFMKGTPLPAERTLKYRAAHALIKDNQSSDLAIKLWEGEFLNDPDTNEWVGNLVLPNDGIRRTVPEGAEIEVTITISMSRLINVSAFVPHANQHFTNDVYLPQREEQDYAALSISASSETAAYRERLEELEEASTGDASVQEQISELRKQLDELEKATPTPGSTGHRADPDDLRRIVENYKTIRGRLGGLERSVIPNREALATKDSIENVEAAEKVIGQFGTSLDQQQLARFRRELERVASKGDDKAIQRVCAEIESLRWRVLFRHDWYWKDILDSLCEPQTPFVNRAEAQILISKGQEAATSGDGEALREAVRGLWKLQPKRKAETMRDRSIGSGLRRF